MAAFTNPRGREPFGRIFTVPAHHDTQRHPEERRGMPAAAEFAVSPVLLDQYSL
jgi:hypothetical protein